MRNILLILLLITQHATAQNIVNGDFMQNNGNDLNLGIPMPCPTFTNGSVPNWIRTNGTPGFSSNLHDISMWAEPGTGEGIAGGYNFKRGQRYCIEVGLAHWQIVDGDLELYAATGIVPNSSVFDCGSAPPFPPNFELIFSGDALDYTNYFLYTPTSDYEQLWILPRGYLTGRRTFVTIAYVNITVLCPTDMTFNNGPVAPGVYEADNIYAGSSFGGLTTVTAHPSNDEVHFKATDQVLIKDNFLAVAHIAHGVESVFTASIESCVKCSKDEERGSGSERRMAAKNSADIPVDGDFLQTEAIKRVNIEISPNPATSKLNINYLCTSNGQLHIAIKDINGQIRKSETLECREGGNIVHSIDVSLFEPGIYIVELTLGKDHMVKKMVKL